MNKVQNPFFPVAGTPPPEKVKRGFHVLKSFMNSVKMKIQDIEISLDIL